MIDTVRLRLAAAVLALLGLAVPVAGAAAPGAAGGPGLPAGRNPAGRDPVARDPAAQAAGLFMQSCVRYAAHPHGLRQWAAGHHLRQVPAPYANSFLYGLAGIVYDASTRAGKLVLVSQDSGSCSVVADHARGAALLHRLDTDLKSAGITYTITADGPDPQEKSLHNRAYDAAFGTRRWLMLVSTVRNPAGGEAMLTTNP